MKTAATKTTKKNTSAMPDEQFRAISRVLADPRRFAILQQVASTAEAGLACGALSMHEEISPATISHHLKELSEAGLILSERDGRCANLTLERCVWDAYVKRLSAL